MMLRDSVFINNLSATAITGKDAWNRPTPQPITITVSLNTNFQEASKTDNLKYSLNYAVISRNIAEFLKVNEHRNFKSLGNIGDSVADVVLDPSKGGGHHAEIVVRSTKSEIRADNIEYKLVRSTLGHFLPVSDELRVNGLKLLTIIGVFTFERVQKQFVELNLAVKVNSPAPFSIHDIIDQLIAYVESSNFKTVEALVMKIGQLVYQDFNHADSIESVYVKVAKPNAITFTDSVGVASLMTKETFSGLSPIDLASESHSSGFNLPTSVEESVIEQKEHVSYIAFGSNMGNQLQNITTALALLEEYGVKVLATSSLYISKPMYFKDQADFYNGAIKVSFSDKSPHQLLAVLKKIEYEHISRVKEFDNGPRLIDLDILLYDNISINTPDLTVPHKSMLERNFVLQPLCELLGPDSIHPVSAEPLHNHLKQLLLSKPLELLQESTDLLQVVPLPRLAENSDSLKFDQLGGNHSTLIMGIMNITPDSFSDGGQNYKLTEEDIVKRAEELVTAGANIIDIGGVSTRPGSVAPSVSEELERVLPVVRAIRASGNSKVASVVISVDTYRAEVAEEVLMAGADIINDISMGLFDSKMFDVIAKYGCPYIMNHIRGLPETMSSQTHYFSNTKEDLIEYIVHPVEGQKEVFLANPEVNNLISGISRELGLQILKAFDRGVRKWQVIIDPGIGFAKNVAQNLAIIKHASDFKTYALLANQGSPDRVSHAYVSFSSFPTLLGPSRKRFLGTICGESVDSERLLSTAASVTACIQQKADIVRVHDVQRMKTVVVTADALYRGIY